MVYGFIELTYDVDGQTERGRLLLDTHQIKAVEEIKPGSGVVIHLYNEEEGIEVTNSYDEIVAQLKEQDELDIASIPNIPTTTG